jgi:hypothetical protein
MDIKGDSKGLGLWHDINWRLFGPPDVMTPRAVISASVGEMLGTIEEGDVCNG